MDEPLWYWILCLLAALLVAVPALTYWLEGRAEKRDRETWDRLNRIGGRR